MFSFIAFSESPLIFRRTSSTSSTEQPKNTMKNKLSHNPESCKSLLQQCEMFEKLPTKHISTIARLMEYKILPKQTILLNQGQVSDRFFLLESGDIKRKFVDSKSGKVPNVEFAIKAKSINSMRILSGDPVHSTVRCVSDECRVFEMQRGVFLNLLKEEPEIATLIAQGLCEQLRAGSKKYQTPMLEQRQQQEINIPAVSIAAGVESYYRSALNAILNARLTGVQGKLFPNMHIQVPSRIAYICGFKGLRSYLDQNIDSDTFENTTFLPLAVTLSPGIIMTPVSSLLEASNAGHINNESMATRWMRGIVPRAGREIIFGIGLNQMSDYFEERLMPVFGGYEMMANAAGSLCAGIVAGYLSHVPHNISTFKLMEPHLSYGILYQKFVDKSVPRVVDTMVKDWPDQSRYLTRGLFATLFPRGVMIRTTQIIGSFMILNGTINYLQKREHKKIQQAINGNA